MTGKVVGDERRGDRVEIDARVVKLTPETVNYRERVGGTRLCAVAKCKGHDRRGVPEWIAEQTNAHRRSRFVRVSLTAVNDGEEMGQNRFPVSLFSCPENLSRENSADIHSPLRKTIRAFFAPLSKIRSRLLAEEPCVLSLHGSVISLTERERERERVVSPRKKLATKHASEFNKEKISRKRRRAWLTTRKREREREESLRRVQRDPSEISLGRRTKLLTRRNK